MRRTAVVVLFAAAALQPVTAGQALAPAERAARISLSAPATVAPHSKVTLTGRTRAGRGAKVKIYQRPTDRSTWNLEGSTRAKKRGTFRYSEGVTDFSRYYRACVRRSCSAARLVTVAKPTPTPTPTPTPQPATLTLTGIPASQIEAGQSITASGTASANLIGKWVALQTYDATNKAWAPIGGAAVDGSGNWSVSGPIGTAGKAIGVRVVSPPTPTTSEAYVGAGVVDVYGWYPLSRSSKPEQVNGSAGYGPATINAIPYSTGAYVYAGQSSATGMAEWNLSRSCKTFTATVGLLDDASTTTRFSYQMFADSVQKATKSAIALGTSNPVTIDVTNALRLKIDVQRNAGYYDDDLVFGDAKALCSF